jgi:hypothetical protein
MAKETEICEVRIDPIEAKNHLHWQAIVLTRLDEDRGGPVRMLRGASLFGPWKLGKDFIFTKPVRWFDDHDGARVFQWRAA